MCLLEAFSSAVVLGFLRRLCQQSVVQCVRLLKQINYITVGRAWKIRWSMSSATHCGLQTGCTSHYPLNNDKLGVSTYYVQSEYRFFYLLRKTNNVALHIVLQPRTSSYYQVRCANHLLTTNGTVLTVLCHNDDNGTDEQT